MTISVPTQLVYSSDGDGATSQFSYPVRILEAGEIVVLRRENGVDTTLTLNTDYTLSGIGDAGGVTITMLSVPTAGQEITRYRATAPKQIVDLKDKQTNPAEAVEQQLDRLAMVSQDHEDAIERAVKLPVGNPTDTEGLAESLLRLADSADEIDTVAGISADVTTVAGVATDVTAVAVVADSVPAVAGVADDIPTVAGIADDVSTVATNVADITNFSDVYLGAKATEPTTRNDDSALQAGDQYFDTTNDKLKIYTGSAWVGGTGDMVFAEDVLDEDDMASDSATKVPTQQSVKAYADSLVLNFKALNADGGFTFNTTATTQDFMPAGTFGGAWKAAHVLASSDDAIFAGTRSTLAVTREVVGTGGLNPETDYTLFLTAKNTDLTDTTLGELGVLRMLTFGNERGDKGLFIGTVYKHKGDGSSEEGAALAYELGTRIIQNNDLTDIVAHHQILGAFYPNPTGPFGGLGHHGYYSEHYVGVGYAHLSGIDTGSGGTGSMTYGIALHRTRDPAERYFTVAAGTGNIESITNAAAGVAGPVWTLNNPGANTAGHVAGRIIFQGVNANAVAVAYGQIQGVVGDPTAGSADGYLSLSAVVGNTVTEQLRIADGVDVRTSLKIAGAQRIDASGGIRFKSYSAAEIGDATHAVNTTDKAAGKSIWDATNGRILTASSSTATSAWIVANGTVAITPA